MNPYKIIHGIPCIDAPMIFNNLRNFSDEDRLHELLKQAGVVFFDQNPTFVKKPSIGLVGIGGLSINNQHDHDNFQFYTKESSFSLTFKDMQNIFSPMQAVGGFMSYLNTGNSSIESMNATLSKYAHFSTLHMTYVNIGIFGITCAVENEFNTQRDIIHLARITEARTTTQSKPPIVVLFPEHLEAYIKLYKSAAKIRSSLTPASLSKKDFLESTNLLYPASKATGLIISGTLRNLKKLTDGLNDAGKEDEYRRVLWYVNNLLHDLWPTIFKPLKEFAYRLPIHIQ